MYSSDSDDDCYGNIAQKLQSIKSKFEIKTIKSSHIFDYSLESKNDAPSQKNEPSPLDIVLVEENTSLNDSGEVNLDLIIAENTKKPFTRSCRKKKENVDLPTQLDTVRRKTRKSRTKDSETSFTGHQRGRKRRGGTANTVCGGTTHTSLGGTVNTSQGGTVNTSQGGTVNTSQGGTANTVCGGTVNTIENDLARGANRRRGSARARGRARTNNNLFHNIPIFSVGNTDEYPDMSDNVELFKLQPNNVNIIDIEDDNTEEVEELSVKVYWQSAEIVRFMLRKYQKFTAIFDYFSKKQNVCYEKLFFTYDNRIITVDDTPDSIDYNIGKFIDGGIINQNIGKLVMKNSTEIKKNGLKIKFQCQHLKKPVEIVMSRDEKMYLAMMKCAEHLEVALEKLKFYFDGDLITGKVTAQDLELEGGECIDVKIIT